MQATLEINKNGAEEATEIHKIILKYVNSI